MHTNYIHFGETNIKEVISLTNWELGNEDGEISVKKAIESQYFYINNGSDYMWLDTDEMGIIKTFTNYGGSDADFLMDLIGYTISEYDYDIVLTQDSYYEEKNDLKELLKDNTYFHELEKVA